MRGKPNFSEEKRRKVSRVIDLASDYTRDVLYSPNWKSHAVTSRLQASIRLPSASGIRCAKNAAEETPAEFSSFVGRSVAAATSCEIMRTLRSTLHYDASCSFTWPTIALTTGGPTGAARSHKLFLHVGKSGRRERGCGSNVVEFKR